MQDRHLRWPPTFSLVPKWSPIFEILESPLNRHLVRLTLCFKDFTPTNICEMRLAFMHR